MIGRLPKPKAMNIYIKLFFIAPWAGIIESSINGQTFMDPINMKAKDAFPRDNDPCTPLYWYPRNIPEYCNYMKPPLPSKPTSPQPRALPVPVPVPVPIPQPPPLFAPQPPIIPILQAVSFIPPLSSIFPIPNPPQTLPLINYYPGPSNHNRPQAGMVPGLPGLVTREGGINILPFSDAYSNMLENHKNKIIRKKIQKLLKRYENYPSSRNYRHLRKYARHY